MALERDSKRVQWSLEKGSAASALVAEREGRTLVYHPGTDGVLRAVDVQTGDMQWMWSSEQSGALSAPVLTDAGLMIGSSSGTVNLLHPDSGKKLWSFEPGVVMEGVTSAPVVDGRQMLFVSNAGILYSFLAPKAVRSWPRPYPEGKRQIRADRPTIAPMELVTEDAPAAESE